MDPRTHLPQDCPPLLKRCKVSVPVASVRRDASRKGAQDTQLLYGDAFDIYKIDRDWAWGQSGSPIAGSSYPGYIGYVQLSHLVDWTQEPTHRIISLKAPVFALDDIKSQILNLLPMGARVTGVLLGSFLKTSGGYVHAQHVQSLEEVCNATDYVGVAERFVGLPYIWGGYSTDGLDCSGLVLAGLRGVGRDGPRDSDMQAHLGVEIASDATLQRGDLIFWKGHVGIMRDSETLLHANAYHMCIASEPFDEACKRIKKTAGPVTARRRIL